jgi:hypothetical protein
MGEPHTFQRARLLLNFYQTEIKGRSSKVVENRKSAVKITPENRMGWA